MEINAPCCLCSADSALDFVRFAGGIMVDGDTDPARFFCNSICCYFYHTDKLTIFNSIKKKQWVGFRKHYGTHSPIVHGIIKYLVIYLLCFSISCFEYIEQPLHRGYFFCIFWTGTQAQHEVKMHRKIVKHIPVMLCCKIISHFRITKHPGQKCQYKVTGIEFFNTVWPHYFRMVC